MFGFGEMAGLMKNLGSLQTNLKQVKAELQTAVVIGKDPSEKIAVELTGSLQVQAVHIDPSLLSPGNAAVLEAACSAAMQSALIQFKELSAQKLSAATGVDLADMMP